jgi:hypothetical protein
LRMEKKRFPPKTWLYYCVSSSHIVWNESISTHTKVSSILLQSTTLWDSNQLHLTKAKNNFPNFDEKDGYYNTFCTSSSS